MSVLAAVTVVGCVHRHAPPPGPGTSRGTPPDLRGVSVMVFPVQRSAGVGGDLDAEVAFGLRSRGPDVGWILPADLQRALDRSPGLGSRVRGLDIAAFGVGEVRRIGDPLYGDLRRLASVVDGQVALIPLQASLVADTAGAGTAVALSATLIDVRGGYVLWFGVVKGDAGDPADPAPLASAADALARTLLWYEGGGV
jgi:hypothetical protein